MRMYMHLFVNSFVHTTSSAGDSDAPELVGWIRETEKHMCGRMLRQDTPK